MDQQVSKPIAEFPHIPVSEKYLGCYLCLNRKSFNREDIFTELKKQLCLAGPLVVVSFLQFSLLMLSAMFVGHLGQLPLAGASSGTSFAGVTGFSLMLGMGGALETLCGQAYGAKQYHMLGVYMQRAMVVFILMCIPISILWTLTGQIFTSLKQDPQISMLAGVYCRWLIPSIFPYSLLQCQLRFLQTQNNTMALITSTGITTSVHVLVCWSLIFRFGLGIKGAALSNAISYWTNVFILAIYIKFSPACERTWKGFSKDGMKNLLIFLKLGVPSALMVCLNTSAVVFKIPFGFGSAVRCRQTIRSSLAAQIVIFLAVLEGLLASSIVVAIRNIWGFLYTNDKELVNYFASVMPLLAISNFMDGIQGVLSGCARGCGWQKIGAFISLCAYYLVGLPSAIILTFVLNLGGKGLWMGIIGGSALQGILLLVITLNTSWEHEARKARDRVCASSISAETALLAN